MKIGLDATLPPDPVFEEGIRRAPDRNCTLSTDDQKVFSEISFNFPYFFLDVSSVPLRRLLKISNFRFLHLFRAKRGVSRT